MRSAFTGFVVLLAAASTLVADTPRPGFQPSGGFESEGNWPVPSIVAGQFVPTEDLFVSALGAYDRGRDGLTSSRPVGLFEVLTGDELASLVVPAGDSTKLVGSFRYVPILPRKLEAGRRYQVVAFHSGPGIETREAERDLVSTPPEISQFRDLLDIRPASGGLEVASSNFSFDILSANFLWSLDPPRIPEPSTASLVACLTAMLAIRKRHQPFARS